MNKMKQVKAAVTCNHCLNIIIDQEKNILNIAKIEYRKVPGPVSSRERITKLHCFCGQVVQSESKELRSVIGQIQQEQARKKKKPVPHNGSTFQHKLRKKKRKFIRSKPSSVENRPNRDALFYRLPGSYGTGKRR